MKFKPRILPQEGNLRIITRFLWLPKTLPLDRTKTNVVQTRWLERASWFQLREPDYQGGSYWYDLQWAERVIK